MTPSAVVHPIESPLVPVSSNIVVLSSALTSVIPDSGEDAVVKGTGSIHACAVRAPDDSQLS